MGFLRSSTYVRRRRMDVENQSVYAPVKDVPIDVCYMKDSPYRIHKVAASGDLKKLSELLSEDPSRAKLKDRSGWTAAHHAAHKGIVDVLATLVQRGADINEQDDSGQTALHLAVLGGHCEVINFLVLHHADGKVLNKDRLTPLHQAVVSKQYDCLKSLLKHGQLDVHAPGEFGITPLHTSAIADDVTAAKIILDHGAYMCKRDDMGITALHMAAKKGSKATLELFLSLAEAKGYTRDQLLNTQDNEKCSPLHSAINSGNTEPVRVCLEAGANIDTTQADGSTPVHLVCSQGALNIVKVMFEVQPSKKAFCLSAQDANGMTPLHKAALFDYSELVKYLIDQGSPLNLPDCNGRTPLLLSASRHCWETVNVLLSAGADPAAKDEEGSNFLHLAVRSGGSVDDFEFKYKCFKHLLNEKDNHGCTPLHYASKEGYLLSISGLLDSGANITCQDNSKQSALHFAAQYGRLNTCRKLLDTLHGARIMNESDGNGRTALHLASENGHMKVVALLMQRGALLHRDYKGNSPLHLAAQSGFVQTMKILLNVHPSLLNTENMEGNTPLHAAAIHNKMKSIQLLLSLNAAVIENKDSKTFLDIAIERSNLEATIAVVSHDRWQEIFRMKSSAHGTYMLALVQYLPDACQVLLDRCMIHSEHDRSSRDYSITYNFEFVGNNYNHLKEKDDDPDRIPMLTMSAMVHFHRVKALSHPVCLKYLHKKWVSFGFVIHLLNMLIYLLFLGCFTSLMLTKNPVVTDNEPNVNLSMHNPVNRTLHEPNPLPEPSGKAHNLSETDYLLIVVVAVFLFINIAKEFVQLWQMKYRYFLDPGNYLELVLYTTSALFTFPLLSHMDTTWSWNCGSVALFLAWFNLLLFLQRFEFTGIYVVMFLEILRTLLQVVIVFSILIVAFGVTFYSLLRQENSAGFASTAMSIFSSLVMMIGELNYVETFVLPLRDETYSVVVFILLFIFLLFMPIILMNLLIGLAVGDIESVKKNARLKRLAMQVELTADLESKLPVFLMKRFDIKSLTIHPNGCKQTFVRWYQNWIGMQVPEDADAAEKSNFQKTILQQKQRLKDVQAELAAQTEILKLIVQKMEIKTEASERDEGHRNENADISLILKQAASKGRMSKAIQHTVQQTKVIKQWERQTSKKDLMEIEESCRHETQI